MDWTIITPTIPERKERLEKLVVSLRAQIRTAAVQHLVIETPLWIDENGKPTPGCSVGEKVRQGFERAVGDYVSVVDDDDEVADNFVSSVLARVSGRPDVITFGVRRPGQQSWWLRANVARDDCSVDGDGNSIKLANHLCVWRRDIALSSPCLPRNYSWDYLWYTAIKLSRPDLVEAHVPEMLYTYHYSPDGTRAQRRDAIAASQDLLGANFLILKDRAGNLYVKSRDTRVVWTADGSTVNRYVLGRLTRLGKIRVE